MQYPDLHKDTISNGRCVVPLRKEYVQEVEVTPHNTNEFSASS
jgi:hypothetical protein